MQLLLEIESRDLEDSDVLETESFEECGDWVRQIALAKKREWRALWSIRLKMGLE